jgi:putative hydrolase of the HAD superfamily
MSPVTTIFFDIGGVLLTDGWGRTSRRAAAEKFHLDWDEFSDRHEKLAQAIETHRISLEDYLDRAVFYRPREFSQKEFRDFMFAQSEAKPESLAIVAELARSRKYFLATINNEMLELNLFRLEHFGLRLYFPIFFSSCFVGLWKPDEAIYRLALNVTQRAANECIFIDDREVNLECPSKLGINTIRFESAAQLRAQLGRKGIEF